MRLISTQEVAVYVVCPEAWRLKFLHGTRFQPGPEMEEAKELRRSWFSAQETSEQLRRYAKVAYILLFLLTLVVFLFEAVMPLARREGAHTAWEEILRAKQAIPTEILLLMLTLGVIIFIWDLFERRSRNFRSQTGISEASRVVALQGSHYLPSRLYSSEQLGVVGQPDAVIVDGEFTIPVERRPLGKRVQDRHVAQLHLDMALIEATEGKRPPYGILVLGAEEHLETKRIRNSPEKQRWVESLLDEMRSIIDGVPAVPAPNRHKCRNCDVRHSCKASAHKQRD